MEPRQHSRSGCKAPGVLDRLARGLVLRQFAQVRGGRITLRDGEQTWTLGNPQGDLAVELQVHTSRFYRRLVTGGGLGAAESLMDGDWTCDDLTTLVRIFTRDLRQVDAMDSGLATLKQWLARGWLFLRRNTPVGARRNISEHYDLGNDFYSLMLDPTMSYSCGIFEQPHSTLHEASLAKLDRVCRKLDLRPSDHLVEIGTGWGGLAVYAAERFGCRVTTTTISREQYDYAVARVRAAGLEHRITVLQEDYRRLQGTYDKLVSIEMIEAVGPEFFETYFATCSRLLKPSGAMLLQGIVIEDQRFEQHVRGVDFIRKYIFPGGCLPSVVAIGNAVKKATDLRFTHLEDISSHYVKTLRAWRDNFWRAMDDVRAQGYSERFIRMWDYYLCYCEAAFEERYVRDVQIMFAKPQFRQERIDFPESGRVPLMSTAPFLASVSEGCE